MLGVGVRPCSQPPLLQPCVRGMGVGGLVGTRLHTPVASPVWTVGDRPLPPQARWCTTARTETPATMRTARCPAPLRSSTGHARPRPPRHPPLPSRHPPQHPNHPRPPHRAQWPPPSPLGARTLTLPDRSVCRGPVFVPLALSTRTGPPGVRSPGAALPRVTPSRPRLCGCPTGLQGAGSAGAPAFPASPAAGSRLAVSRVLHGVPGGSACGGRGRGPAGAPEPRPPAAGE